MYCCVCKDVIEPAPDNARLYLFITQHIYNNVVLDCPICRTRTRWWTAPGGVLHMIGLGLGITVTEEADDDLKARYERSEKLSQLVRAAAGDLEAWEMELGDVGA